LTNNQLALLNSVHEQAFIDSYLEFARQAYLLTVASNPDYEKFKNGWLNRVEKIRTYVYSKFQQAFTNAVVGAKENALPIGIVSAIIITGIVFYYLNKDKKSALVAEGI
jgi:lysozyme family protein